MSNKPQSPQREAKRIRPTTTQDKKPEMKRMRITKQWESLQAGDILLAADGQQYQVMTGFDPSAEYVMLLPLNGQPRAKFPQSTVKNFKLPEFEVLVPDKEQKPVVEQTS